MFDYTGVTLLENRPGVSVMHSRFAVQTPAVEFGGQNEPYTQVKPDFQNFAPHFSILNTEKTMTLKHTDIRCLYYNNGLEEKRITENYVTDMKAGARQRNINIQVYPELLSVKQRASNQSPRND